VAPENAREMIYALGSKAPKVDFGKHENHGRGLQRLADLKYLQYIETQAPQLSGMMGLTRGDDSFWSLVEESKLTVLK
jgi:hypothetical protein